MSQLQPETGESQVFFSKHLSNFFSQFFTRCIEEGIKGNIFGHLI